MCSRPCRRSATSRCSSAPAWWTGPARSPARSRRAKSSCSTARASDRRTSLPAQFGPDGRLATTLGGTQVLFDGTPAPLSVCGERTTRRRRSLLRRWQARDPGAGAQRLADSSDLVALPVAPVAPSIFSADYTGSGQGAILNQDGVTVNSTAAPAAKGSIIAIYATGEGQTNPGGVDGQLANGATLPKPKLPIQVLINGKPAEVQYAGAAPKAVAGLFQVNAKIPRRHSVGRGFDSGAGRRRRESTRHHGRGEVIRISCVSRRRSTGWPRPRRCPS